MFSEAGGYRGAILPLKASGHTYNEEVDSLPVGWDYVELRFDALAHTDVRTALITFGSTRSHGWERIHVHALRSLAELVTAYATSPVEIQRDQEIHAGIAGFTRQPTAQAAQDLGEDSEPEG